MLSLKLTLSCIILKTLRLSIKSWVWHFFCVSSVILFFDLGFWYTFWFASVILFLTHECYTFFESWMLYFFWVMNVILFLSHECYTFFESWMLYFFSVMNVILFWVTGDIHFWFMSVISRLFGTIIILDLLLVIDLINNTKNYFF